MNLVVIMHCYKTDHGLTDYTVVICSLPLDEEQLVSS